MTGRLALLVFAAAVCACDAPKQAAAPVRPAPPQETAAALSAQQVNERAGICEQKSREKFRRDSRGGIDAGFVHHYNAQLDTCFYLLTVTQQETLSRKLLDISENETYGEYLGPASGIAATCRVESLYCASGREWEVLVEPYMRN